MSASIQVAIKVRPLIKREENDNLPIQWSVQDKYITPLDPELKKRGEGGFHFDHIFDMTTTTEDVFNTVAKPIVEAAVNGFNGTIFAYGQTSSGKTYTMMGTPNEPGVIPLSVMHIFNLIQKSDRQFLLRVSYIEIYNERVNDLLDTDGIDLKIKDDAKGQAFVQCKEELVNSPDRVLDIMKKGDKNRRIGETNMNERSSRSHTILRITIESREANADDSDAIQVSQLNMVDLAGSERAGQTGAIGTRFKEGTHINMSLSALGLVILQLSESQDNPKIFVNFRDSKLTRILQPSLGGNAMTTIICAVTPAALEETQCTLAFASRAKRVKNKPKLNEELSEAALLKRYAKHISRLETELKKVKSADVVEMESKLLEKERANQILEERIVLLKNSILCGNSASGKEGTFKSIAKRRRTWGGAGTLDPVNSMFQNAIGLPTIIESDRTPEKKREQFKQHSKSRQSIIVTQFDIAKETFQTEFPDFERELIECERARVDRRLSDVSCESDDDQFITKRTVKFWDDVSVHSSTRRSFDAIVEQKSPGQCNDERALPETPAAALRKKINVLVEQYNSLSEENGKLLEFTRLERQMIVDEEVEKAVAEHNEKLVTSEQIICKLNDKYAKLQIHSAETERLLADSTERLSELERQMSESIKSLRNLEREKQALVDELNKQKGETQASETSTASRENKEISVFENASYVDDMNVSYVRADSVLSNDTRNTLDLTMNESNVGNITANTTVTSDVREVKFLAEKLKETVQLLTAENTEVMNKLANEKERANKNEKHLQDTISELLTKIHAITEENNLLKNTVWELEHRLEKSDANGPTNVTEDESAQSIENYKATIASLTAENIELSSNLMNKIEELDRVKDLKFSPGNHDCAYRELSVNLSERNKLLEKENIELSNDLMEKIEEHDQLREQFEALLCRLTSFVSINRSNLIEKEQSDRSSAEFVDDLLQRFVVENKLNCDTNEKVQTADEPTVEKIERSSGLEIGVATINEMLQTSTIPNGNNRENVSNDTSSSENDTSWKIRAELLAEQVVHLQRLNEKFKDLEHRSCKQCSYLNDLNESRRALKAETKDVKRKLVKLQKKLDRECADSEILRTKANEDLDLTMHDSTMNESSVLDSSFSVTVFEDRVQGLRHELDTLKNKYAKVTDDYNEICNEIEKLRDVSSRETTPTKSPGLKRKHNKYAKLETDLDNLKTELRRLKKGMAAVSGDLQKFSNEKTIVSNEIESLKAKKRELQEKFAETEDSSIAIEKIETSERHVDRLGNETKIFEAVKDDLENAKASPEAEVRGFKSEKSLEVKLTETGYSSIAEEKIRSLENEVSRLSEELDASNAVKKDLLNAKMALEAEVHSLKITKESCEVKIVDTKNASSEVERIVSLEKYSTRLIDEVETLNVVKEDLQTAKSSLEAEVRSSITEKESVETRSLMAEKESFEGKIPAIEDTSIYEEKIERLENDFSSLSKEIEISNDSKEVSESAKSSLEAEVRSLEGAKVSLEGKLRRMEIEVTRLNEQASNSNTAERELQHEKILPDAEVRSLQAAKESLEEKLGQMEIEVARLNEQIGNSNTVELKNTKSLLDSEVRSLQAAKESLEGKLGQMEIEVARLNEQIGASNSADRELQNAKSLLEAEVRSLQAAKESLASRFSKTEESSLVNEKMSATEAEVNDSKSQLKHLTDSMNEFAAENASLKKKLMEFEESVEELTSSKLLLNNEVASLRNEIRKLESSLSVPNQRHRDGKSDSLKEEKSDLPKDEKTIDALNILVRELTIEIDRYVAENAELNAKISELESTLKNQAQNFIETNSIEIEETPREEVTLSRKCIVKEIESMKPNNECQDFYEKSISEPIGLFRHELTSREKEIIKMLTSSFEEEKRKLEESVRHSVDAEKRTNVWAKELEADIERTQEVLYRQEAKNAELITEITRLNNHLMESSHENKMLKEKIDVLELDFKSLQVDLENSIEFESRSGTKQNTTQQERETLIEETLTSCEMELSSKLGLTEEQYGEKFEEFTKSLESCPMRNTELTDSLEVFEIKEKQIRNIVETKSSELVKCNNTIESVQTELAHMTERRNSLSTVYDEKGRQLEEVTTLLKNKCDEISEYKTKLETLTPEYELLKDQATERNLRLEKYKREIECMTTENEKLKALLREKLDSEETNSANYRKHTVDLMNRNTALQTEMGELRNVVDAKSSDLVKCNITIETLQSDLAHLTEQHNSLSTVYDEKSRQLEEVTTLLKNKCDKLSEYKTKLETLTPEYELLKDQATERNLRLEKYKREIECMTTENEKLKALLREKLDSEETNSANYRKHTVDLMNRNTALQTEMGELRNVVDAKSSDLVKCNNTIETLQSDLAHLTEQHNSLSTVYDEKSRQLEEVTTLLKNKCDKLSEYKTKLETLTPEYELLKDQVTERNLRLEKYKSEIERMTTENEELKASLKEKLNSDEIKSAGYRKQLADLTNRNIALQTELDELRNVVDTKSSDLVKCNNTIETLQSDLAHLTEQHNSLSTVYDEKSRKLEEVTTLLKNKCDKLSEYKTKVETLTPEYELLKDQVTERNLRLEKYKSEIERMTTENEELKASLKEKLNSDEIKSAGYRKQLADLTNRNIALRTELDELRNVVDTKSSELVKCNNNIERMQIELGHLTEKHNSLSSVCDEKSRQLEEITALLKNKCDELSEYSMKLETITPEYELLKDQAAECKLRLEKYKSEIDRITTENEKRTASLTEKLDSEEIKSASYRKQLADLTNRNTALRTELDELRTKCDELERANGKPTRSLRNNTSRFHGEEEMEDLRESNRTLQKNLEGAANRIAELQEMRMQTMKELAELRGIHEIVCNENAKMKYTLAVHRSSFNDALELRGKYELLVQEKNRLTLVLEDEKSKIAMLESKLESLERENEELKSANKELDDEIEDMVAKIHELTKENAELDDKLYQMSTQTSGGGKREMNDHESEIARLKSQIDRLRGELATALKTSERLRSDPVSCGSSRSGSPTLEQEAARIDNRRRRSRTELFNQKRQLDVFVEDEKLPSGEGCRCIALEKQVRELERELVSKNGEVAALEIRIQSENFPYIKKAKDLEELLGSSKRRLKILEAELLHLREVKSIEISSGCNRCKQWAANKRDQSSQCMPDSSMILMEGISSGTIEERIQMEKREKVIDTLKSLCRTRQRNILELEKKNKELERRVRELNTNSSKINLREDDKSELSTASSQSTTSRLDSGRALKENVLKAQDVERPATHLRRNWFDD